jgi:hypothetical protein
MNACRIRNPLRDGEQDEQRNCERERPAADSGELFAHARPLIVSST